MKKKKVNLIKEYCYDTDMGRLRSYDDLEYYRHILMLISEARKDFHIRNGDIKIIAYPGKYYRYSLGIEFNIRYQAVPSDYIQLNKFDFLYRNIGCL